MKMQGLALLYTAAMLCAFALATRAAPAALPLSHSSLSSAPLKPSQTALPLVGSGASCEPQNMLNQNGGPSASFASKKQKWGQENEILYRESADICCICTTSLF